MNIWTEYTIVAQAPEAYAEQYAVTRLPDIEDGAVLCILALEDPTLPGDSLVWAYDETGARVGPIDDALAAKIRPLGNSPETVEARAGIATGRLEATHYAGWEQREFGDNGNDYPTENPPFYCECRMLENVIYGWYPRWEISMEDGTDVGRDPSVRNVRVFSSVDCLFPSEYLYTTGAFIYGDSLWHTTDDGQPVKVWWSESNQFTTYDAPLYFAIYFSEYENGRFHLNNAGEQSRRLFWENNQPSDPNTAFAAQAISAAGDNVRSDFVEF